MSASLRVRGRIWWITVVNAADRSSRIDDRFAVLAVLSMLFSVVTASFKATSEVR